MTITAAMVKELRERTGAGMMECKKALQEVNGDMEEAITEMRKRGQAKAAKRAGKIAAEGAIALQISDDVKKAFMVEVNSETDFVARDENFVGFIDKLAGIGLEQAVDSAEALLALSSSDEQFATIEDERMGLIHKIGENINVRRAALLESNGCVGAYKHGARIGVLVAIDTGDAELARDLAMHIAAMSPQAIDESGMPEAVVAKEREIFIAQAKESGKPDNVIEKMVTGRIAKFMKEACLLGQTFVKNPDQLISALLKEKGAKVLSFVRFEVGDGIEKETVDFAEEVRAQVQGSD
ncbi:MAG: translation elongation factor Ts [Gammaproteobacteria bacterium]|nr:translation elongation factor Ts [Gammaproteobacteria bacterium]MCH9744038.1 translation elongation factor Ts [Gammaproteobacteria bacterium]